MYAAWKPMRRGLRLACDSGALRPAGMPLDPGPACHTLSYMSDSLSIRLDAKLFKRLQRMSKQQNRSSSDIAREALRRYMDAEEVRQIRERLRPHAEARGFLTDEDVFKAVS